MSTIGIGGDAMKCLVIRVLSVLFVTMGLPVCGQLLVDDFAYPENDLLTAHGWTAYQSEPTPITVTGGSLSYAGYSTGIGNAVTVTQSWATEAVQRSFVSQSSGSVYVSFLLQIESAIPFADFVGNAQIVQLGPAGMDSNPTGVRLYVYRDQAKIRFAISKSGSMVPSTNADYDFNTPILIVLKYEFVPNAGNDDPISLFVNPVLGGAEPAATIVVSSGATDAPEIAEIGIRGWDYDPPGADVTKFILDGLQVTSSWPTGSTALVFADGFETNGFTAWSNSVP